MSRTSKRLIAALVGCVLAMLLGYAYLSSRCGHDHALLDTKTSLLLIMSAIGEYRKDTGNYPSEPGWVGELKGNAISRRLIGKLSEDAWSAENIGEIRDGWGTAIKYSPNDEVTGRPVLTSAGPDGDMTTEEDNVRRAR